MISAKRLERAPDPSRTKYIQRKPRCQLKIRSISTGNFGYDRSRCCRFATHIVNGVKLCKQHAGDMCLKIILGEQ